MNYKLFSRTQQTAGRNNQQYVYGNLHNNALGGYEYPPKTDGMLNRIHTANQYEGPTHNFEGAINQGNYNKNYQPQNDFHFYQGNYEMPQVTQQQTSNQNQGKANYYGDKQQQGNQKYGDVHYGAGQWQNTIENYQTLNNWQPFDHYAKPTYGCDHHQKQTNWHPQGNRRHNGGREDSQENLEFKYRVKPDGQFFVKNSTPLVYTKNMIPDISVFSRSESSIEAKRRKRSISDSDLEAEVSDYVSEDIENSRRKRHVKGMHTHKTKSQADAEFSGLANIKIEGLIQRKFAIKHNDKKSRGPKVTDRVSKGNSASIEKPTKTTDPVVMAAIKEHLEKEKKSPSTHISKAKQSRNKAEREKAENLKYNRDELIATLQELIRTGKLDSLKVKVFNKYDEDAKKEIKYVRINIGEITEFNDHIISVKHDAAHKAPKDSATNKKDNRDQEPKKLTGGAVAAKTRIQQVDQVNHQNKASFYQQPITQQQLPDVKQVSADRQPQDDALDGQRSLSEQAMHKTMTGKLQRNIRKMSDDDKLTLFKQLKSNLDELSTNQYVRYVLVLLLKTNVTSIVDALIAYFDKKIMDIIKHKNGLLLSQSLIDLKFKDVRLRRSLKRIDDNLADLMADQYAPLVVLTYANQLPSSDMEDFVEYCKKEFRVCIHNPTACRVFAKVFGKVSDVDRMEMELNIKTIMPQIFDGSYGNELVEVFFSKADPQNQMSLKQTIFDNLPKYLTKDSYVYFFLKAIEQKKTDLIDTLMAKIFKGDSFSDKQVLDILNNSTGYRTILSFFTLTSLMAKDLMRVKLIKLRESHDSQFNIFGTKVLTLCDNYFSAPSK